MSVIYPYFPIVSTQKATQQITQNQADPVLHNTLVFACVRGTAVAHALRLRRATKASDAVAWLGAGWRKLGGHTSWIFDNSNFTMVNMVRK